MAKCVKCCISYIKMNDYFSGVKKFQNFASLQNIVYQLVFPVGSSQVVRGEVSILALTSRSAIHLHAGSLRDYILATVFSFVMFIIRRLQEMYFVPIFTPGVYFSACFNKPISPQTFLILFSPLLLVNFKCFFSLFLPFAFSCPSEETVTDWGRGRLSLQNQILGSISLVIGLLYLEITKHLLNEKKPSIKHKLGSSIVQQ